MSVIKLKSVFKIYNGNIPAVQDFSLEIEEGEFLVLAGPSGCGKTTVLRMIAGLETISAGELWIDGVLSNQVEAKSRNIAMVFQNYALYPHMTVYENMALGLELRHFSRKEIDERVRQTAKELQIAHLLNRKPRTLSGGQRQRVALGRAAVRKPQIFLLDEPLSNLDAELRVKMRMLIERLHQKLDATFVYVTHDQSEAMTLADRICVMKDGFIQQSDTPKRLYERPNNLFVAESIGSPPMNQIHSRLRRVDDAYYFTYEGIWFPVIQTAQKADRLEHYVDRDIIVGIRPERISLWSENDDATRQNNIKGVVTYVEQLGSFNLIHVQVGNDKFIARSAERKKYDIGEETRLQFDVSHTHIFSAESRQALSH